MQWLFDGDDDRDALIDSKGAITFGQIKSLVSDVDGQSTQLSSGVVLLDAESDRRFVIKLLGLLAAQRCVAIASPRWTEQERRKRSQLLATIPHPEARVILFTSGSTGVPKAVQLSAANIVANTDAVIQSLEFDRAKTQALFLPLCYSFGLLGQLLPALRCGVTTYLLRDFSEVNALMASEQIPQMWSGVPTHLSGLCRLAERVDQLTDRITHVVSAGAHLPTDHRFALMRTFRRATIYHNYGMTECSPRILSFNSRDTAFLSAATGYAVGKIQTRVSADDELCVTGPQVMLGYLGEDIVDQNGWFNTRDFADVDANGLVTIRGRSDDLYNVGGERIHLAEIEVAIRQLDEIDDVVVIARDDGLYGKKWVALCEGNDELLNKNVRYFVDRLKAFLSAPKIPKEFYVTTQIPKTENGKISRRFIEDNLNQYHKLRL